MIALIDLDSILYQAVYKVVSYYEIKDAIEKYGKESARTWMQEQVLNEGVNRCENRLLQIQSYLQSIMIEEITGYELFITTCENSFRKKVSPAYKANRKRNSYVWLLRANYQMTENAFYSDTLEADDLINIRAKELGKDNCIVVSIDKDLKQIGGYFWSYYRQKEKDSQGNVITQISDLGIELPVMEYKQREIEYITDEQANKHFWKQMLMGDTSDNISGLKRIGEKTAEKILLNTKCNWFAAARKYIEKHQKQDWDVNYQLLKLKDNY